MSRPAGGALPRPVRVLLGAGGAVVAAGALRAHAGAGAG